MNCYFTCQKLSKFSKTCFTAMKETALAPFNLDYPVNCFRFWGRHIPQYPHPSYQICIIRSVSGAWSGAHVSKYWLDPNILTIAMFSSLINIKWLGEPPPRRVARISLTEEHPWVQAELSSCLYCTPALSPRNFVSHVAWNSILWWILLLLERNLQFIT